MLPQVIFPWYKRQFKRYLCKIFSDTYSEASSALQLIIAESSSSATEMGSKIVDEEQPIEQIAEQVVARDSDVENYEDVSRS